MAQTCPALESILNANNCLENYGGVGSAIYVGLKADLSAPMTATEDVYTTPAFETGKGLYKYDCKENSQHIVGGNLGYRKGFKITLTAVIEAVNEASAKQARALNNQDIFIIIKDGDVSQILYDPEHNIRFEADGIQSDTGTAPADDRITTLNAILQPVKYSNLFVTEPAQGGWDSLMVQ